MSAKPSTEPSRAYWRLVLATAGLTFLLVIVGGVVRVSDSGLGCGRAGSGTDGWPLCGGRAIPGVDTNMIVEYTHRALASGVGVLILLLCVWAWRRYRARPWVLWSATAALALVIAQGALGGIVVEEDLHEALVAGHLFLAMALLGTMMLLAYAARPAAAGEGDRRPAPVEAGGRLRVLVAVTGVTVLMTIVSGGYMAGTQGYGRADRGPGEGAHLACGKQFPTCNGKVFPFGQTRLSDIHLTHRALMYLTAALMIATFIAAWRSGEDRLRRLAGIALAILFLQIVLGALNVWLGEHATLIVFHLTVGTLLWLSVVTLGLALVPLPRPQAARARPRREVEAVPA